MYTVFHISKLILKTTADDKNIKKKSSKQSKIEMDACQDK